MSDVNIRGIAAEALLQMEKENLFLSAIEAAILDKYDYLEVKDKSFFKRLMDGTTEQRLRIDYICGLFSNTKVNKLKPYIRAVLRMSIYQIMWMDSVPDSAACNEAVKLVRKSSQSGLSGFVNGVLRNISRNKENIKYPDKNKDWVKYASVIYSCPEWIVSKLLCEKGMETAEKVLAESLNTHPLSVRCRIENISKLEDEWTRNNITFCRNPLIPEGRLLDKAGAVSLIPGYTNNAFVVQDTGSMMVAYMAGIKPGDIIMDVCAAPGGKSIHASDILCRLEKDKQCSVPGHVYSYDSSEDRAQRIKENIDRLKISNITVQVHDATEYMEDMKESADVVIVDAPCSGLGVIGHKSDIKYRLQPEDIKSLSDIQKSILDVAVKYVKPGGRLVYSTCTISRQENEEQVEYILKKGECKLALDMTNPLNLLPGQDKSDGFFVAVFEKTNE